MYIDILRRRRDEVRRERPEKWRTSSWFLLLDNAPAHRSVLVKDFLSNNAVITLEYPPYSPGLAEFNFYLFSLMKSALKGRRFCDSTDNIKNVMEELKKDFTKWFPGMFPTSLLSLAEVYSCLWGLF